MADDQQPSVAAPAPIPAAAPAVVPAVPVPTFSEKLQMDIGTLWANYKIFLIIFGVLIVTAKVLSFAMDFLAASSRKEVDSAKQQDAVLKAKEDALNAQANDLVKKADDLPTQQPEVTEDWNVKKR